jgi:hypothetical protein
VKLQGLRRLLGQQDRRTTLRLASLRNLRPFQPGFDPRRNLTQGPHKREQLDQQESIGLSPLEVGIEWYFKKPDPNLKVVALLMQAVDILDEGAAQ